VPSPIPSVDPDPSANPDPSVDPIPSSQATGRQVRHFVREPDLVGQPDPFHRSLASPQAA
jgi:hypothetical protein